MPHCLMGGARCSSSPSPEPSLQAETKPLCPTGLSRAASPQSSRGTGWLKPCGQGAVTREEARRERKGARAGPAGNTVSAGEGEETVSSPAKPTAVPAQAAGSCSAASRCQHSPTPTLRRITAPLQGKESMQPAQEQNAARAATEMQVQKPRIPRTVFRAAP